MINKLCLFAIILLAVALRLYRIDSPLADWHSWRQADTSAVSRNFVKNGFDLLHPRFDDLSNVASGKENLQGYRFVEFPFYNSLQAAFFRYLGYFSLEIWGRITSVIFSVGSLLFLYLLARRFTDDRIALLTAFFFAVLPFNVYYGRVTLPEPLLVFTCLGMLYCWSGWIETKPKISLAGFMVLLAAVIFTAVTLLIKPYGLFYLLPAFYLALKTWRFKLKLWLVFAFSICLSFIPFLLWRMWMAQFPEGIPAYDWLVLSTIRFKGAFYYWMFAERIPKLILGYWGILLLGLGLAAKSKPKEGLFFIIGLLGALLYLFVVAGGNVQHDYYQVIIVPVICIFLAKGAALLLESASVFSRPASWTLLAVCLVFMLAFSWYQVRDYFNINNSKMIIAGKAADQLIPANAKVIAPYGGDTAFLYQTNRQGWPVGIEIEKMVALGAQYYVNFNFGPETEWLSAQYCPLVQTEDYLIIDLAKKCP